MNQAGASAPVVVSTLTRLELSLALPLGHLLRHAIARGFAFGVAGSARRKFWIGVGEAYEREAIGFVELGPRDAQATRGLGLRQMTKLR